MAERWQRVAIEGVEVVARPMSDGGDGFLSVVRHYRSRLLDVNARVRDPWDRSIVARWAWDPSRRTAYIESAQAIGGAPAADGPLRATTFGLGQLIAAAAALGTRRLWLGLGGSATVDGGLGMARALGYRFLGPGRTEILDPAQLPTLRRIVAPDTAAIGPGVTIVALADVRAPLIGSLGAARAFGPQKGADATAIAHLESGLVALDRRWTADLGAPPDLAERSGAGAAGGLGAGCVAFLGAELRAGAPWCARLAKLSEALHAADGVVTGEGRFDAASELGKAAGYVLARARKAGTPSAIVTADGAEDRRTLDELSAAFERAVKSLLF